MVRTHGQGRRVKVAIVGGGYAALTAAFELTSPRNPHHTDYEVTIYTAGWRLGGKAASSRRNVAGGEGNSAIIERAPHLWMGWYENAFQVVRELYQEWTGGDPDAWRDAFDTATVTATPIKMSGANGRLWKFDLPPAPGLPGDAQVSASRRTVGDVLSRLWSFTATLLESLDAAGGRVNPMGGLSTSDRVARLLRGSRVAEPIGAPYLKIFSPADMFRAATLKPRGMRSVA
jgi:uncharacterized protein with NAD-binding domain and iron-sulfur cluster